MSESTTPDYLQSCGRIESAISTRDAAPTRPHPGTVVEHNAVSIAEHVGAPSAPPRSRRSVSLDCT